MQIVNTQVSLCIHTILPEPSLFTDIINQPIEKFRQREVVLPLRSFAYTFEEAQRAAVLSPFCVTQLKSALVGTQFLKSLSFCLMESLGFIDAM